MIGFLGWSPRDFPGLTLAMLIHAHDAKLVNQWDQTSTLAALIYNVTITIHNLASKSKARPKGPGDFNPYRRRKPKGLVITGDKEGMKALRLIGNAIAAGNKKRPTAGGPRE